MFEALGYEVIKLKRESIEDLTLEGLKKGEKITLVVNDKEYNYEIISVKKVNSDDIEKIEDKNKKELTLITNAEEGKRVVVYAK